MPYAYREPDVALEHNGVTIWPVYKDGMADETWNYWFTTDQETCDQCHGHVEYGHFDARMLAGRWSETPTVDEWEKFWKPRFRREREAIDALIRIAIDEGRLPHNKLSSSQTKEQ